MDLFTLFLENFTSGIILLLHMPAIQQYFSYVRVKQNTTKEVDVKIEQYEPN
jgi:hypothetical protein